MKKCILLISMVLFFSNAFANEYYRERTITGAGVYYSGNNSVLIIDIDGDKSGMAACASSGRFAISSSAPHYKEMVSIAMTAYASKQTTVDLYVTQTCHHWGNSQDVMGIKVGTMPW